MRRQQKEKVVVRQRTVQHSNELSEISEQITVKQQELEGLRSEIVAVRADIQNLESLKKTARAEVEEEKVEILEIAREEANEVIKETTALKASALAEVEELKKIAREFQRVDEIQRVLSSTRYERDSLNASLNKILADLVLVAPLLEGSKSWFPSTKDLRGESREWLLNLAKQEGWKGE
jgi:chromosome segregation ATPase